MPAFFISILSLRMDMRCFVHLQQQVQFFHVTSSHYFHPSNTNTCVKRYQSPAVRNFYSKYCVLFSQKWCFRKHVWLKTISKNANFYKFLLIIIRYLWAIIIRDFHATWPSHYLMMTVSLSITISALWFLLCSFAMTNTILP